jgi:hypothetical protein
MSAGCAAPPDNRLVEDVVVLQSSDRPPFRWGIVAVFAPLAVISAKSEPMTIFVPYFSEDQFLPARRDRCRIEYEMKPLSGVVGKTTLHLRSAPVAERLACGSRTWSAPQPKV